MENKTSDAASVTIFQKNIFPSSGEPEHFTGNSDTTPTCQIECFHERVFIFSEFIFGENNSLKYLLKITADKLLCAHISQNLPQFFFAIIYLGKVLLWSQKCVQIIIYLCTCFSSKFEKKNCENAFVLHWQKLNHVSSSISM